MLQFLKKILISLIKNCYNFCEEKLVGNLTKSRFCPSLLADGFLFQTEFHFLAKVATAVQTRTSRDVVMLRHVKVFALCFWVVCFHWRKLQAITTCCSLAAGLWGNGERVRKWRAREEMEWECGNVERMWAW